jgi:hypothetical protein
MTSPARIRELLNSYYPLGGMFQPFERPEIPWTPALEDFVAQLAAQKADGPTIASAISMYRPALEAQDMIDVALCVHELIEATPVRGSDQWNKEQQRLDYFNKLQEEALIECQEYAAFFATLSQDGREAYRVETPHPERWAALTREAK